ncbi:MAG: methyltransferase domain-containing protein [bacterium]
MKINLGSGKRRMEGYTNLDILPLENVDIVCDLNKGIPLEENSVDEVFANHFLEHIKNLPYMMEEIYRVCKDGAVVDIRCPYFKSNGAFKDPTHVVFITENTFDYFNKEYTEGGKLPDYGFKCNFKVEKISYIWHSRRMKFVPFKSFLRRYVWNIAHSICFRLIVVK